ncbi:MAG: dTDP-4-dehydrorhamnose reductase, partial [Candidatus Eremiobacteraeota bacterium]|nr:dTDP-4-dehydrorhamnose reductase [Candidatus Eremiobacteraeota bacterium]
MEFWASPEPTIARIAGGRYRDQRRDTGHYGRIDDIERLATLGIGAARYPVLWESVAPDRPDSRSYVWEDERLQRLEHFGIEPILTLLHHGSGPAYTNLCDDDFPELFADYAAATVRR